MSSNEMTERERKVVELLEREGMTLAQVGRVFGVDKERIRQIYDRANRKRFREQVDHVLLANRTIDALMCGLRLRKSLKRLGIVLLSDARKIAEGEELSPVQRDDLQRCLIFHDSVENRRSSRNQAKERVPIAIAWSNQQEVVS